MDRSYTAGFDAEVVELYRRRMQFIRGAEDARDLRNMHSLHFEKLKGDRAGQYSIRLNRQWRLVFRLRKDREGKTVIVLEIVDYH